jgi:hypothetical protein
MSSRIKLRHPTSEAEDPSDEGFETLQTFARYIDDSLKFLRRRLRAKLEPQDFYVSAVVCEHDSAWVLDRLLIGTDSDADQYPDRGRIMTQRGGPKIFTRLDTLVRQLRDKFPGFKSVVLLVDSEPSPQLISRLSKKYPGLAERHRL